MLQTLEWKTLQYRRSYNYLVMSYKLRVQTVAVDQYHLIPTTNMNYLIPQSHTQYHSNSCFPRPIRLWNTLPIYVKSSPSLDIFTERLAVVNM
ncbi:hypothetical protein DPMN_011861 [Dreissena polymorpha]|uniref:Uncharacterized protein n=1 Tax=Dreissena polymorpha TaxID=45954 RepID=A0A9D4N5X7_DREPO|nr:hypothetical protein DPMN_011861 [Dreissena polymorpha]